MVRFALLSVVLVTGCSCRKSEFAFVPPVDSLLLPIPDRPWAAGAPDEGWCGETSIQMTALHFGAWVPQPVINSLGRSTHADLWEEDVPTALDKLGLVYERAQVTTRAQFMSWIVAQLRRGHPVIVGAKILPSANPVWDVDHLMPIVGFSPRGLMFNTNMEPGQVEIPYAALGGDEGISFVSPTGKFYGYAVSGFRTNSGVQLRVVEESPELVKLELTATPGPIHRDDLDGGMSEITARVVTVSASQSALFTH